MKRIVLASGSPRRRELLGMLGIEFDVIADSTPECFDAALLPHEVVCELSRFKGENVSKALESSMDTLIIAADTVVVLDGKIIGKPKNEEHAFELLSALSGKTHSVYTGVYVKDLQSSKSLSFFEKTDVVFRSMEAFEISSYINTGEPMDKAGAYGIQGYGALFVKSICGDYFNVVGLPVCRLGEVLKNEFGIGILN